MFSYSCCILFSVPLRIITYSSKPARKGLSQQWVARICFGQLCILYYCCGKDITFRVMLKHDSLACFIGTRFMNCFKGSSRASGSFQSSLAHRSLVLNFQSFWECSIGRSANYCPWHHFNSMLCNNKRIGACLRRSTQGWSTSYA